MSSVPQGGNVWKNIAIGVVTTVLAYFIVHLIFDKKDSQKVRREKREKIETAWKSVNDYINNSRHKFNTIGCYSCDELQMKKELFRELDQMNKSLENIKGDPELDEKMKTIIDRTTQMFSDEKPILESYYDSLHIARSLPDTEQTAIYRRLQQTMLEQMSHVQTTDTSEIKQYLADLNKKYKTKLEKTEPGLEVNTDELPGTWLIECEFTLKLNNDHTASLQGKGDKMNGKWKLLDKALQLTYADGSTDLFYLIQITDKNLIIYNQEMEMMLGGCRQ
jgi:hypothetical protein